MCAETEIYSLTDFIQNFSHLIEKNERSTDDEGNISEINPSSPSPIFPSNDKCKNKCEILPLIMTPMYISIRLLSSGYFSQAAYIYWTSVLRRPLVMFTSKSASSLLLAHITASSLPFYLCPSPPSASASLAEIREGSWGWNSWNEICRSALSKKNI